MKNSTNKAGASASGQTRLRARSTRALPRGIRRLATSFQVYLRFRGAFHSKTFPLDTPISTMKDWRERHRSALKFGTPAEAAHSFQDDADAYLQLAGRLGSFKDQKTHIEQWARVFGPQSRSAITAADIRLQLEQWRKAGKMDGSGGLKPSSLNRRRTALMAMYTALDGKSQPNIVKDVPAYDERANHQMRAHELLTIARVIRHTKPASKTRARLRLLMWTGWPHALVKTLRPSDVDWKKRHVLLATRRKGQGMASAWVPVLPQAIRALRQFAKVNAWGPFSNSALHSTWALACEKAGTPGIRPYDIKHSFATWAAERIKDDRALKALLRTNSIERYTGGSVMARLESAVQHLQLTRRNQPASDGKGDAATSQRTREKAAKTQ